MTKVLFLQFCYSAFLRFPPRLRGRFWFRAEGAKSSLAALLLVWTVPPAPSQAPGDFLVLKDGRVIEGKKLSRADGGIRLHFANGEVFVPQALVQDCLIEGETPPAPAGEADADQLAKGNVRFEGRWMTRKQRDDLLAKRIAERKKTFADMAARREWRNRAKQATKHFAFEYTLPDDIFENYRDLMEAYFEVFVKDWKIKLPRDLGPLTVCLHVDEEAMIQVGGAGRGVLGYFKFTRPMELNFYHERLAPEFTEEVMFHETNHYLQKLLALDFHMPHFPGESLAEYYGASVWDPATKKLTTGQILESRLCEVQADIAAGNWKGLEPLVSAERDYEHYTWGWSLVHFLMSTPAHAKKFRDFVNALHSAKDIQRGGAQAGADYLKTIEGPEVWRAFQRYMDVEKPEQVRAMESAWHRYIEANLELVSARGYERAAQTAARMNPPRPIKAKRLFQTAIEMGSQNPQTFYGYGKLLMQEKEDLAQAIELLQQAIALDPLEGAYYGALSRAQRLAGKTDEAERLRKLAAEIDPDDLLLVWDLEEDDE